MGPRKKKEKEQLGFSLRSFSMWKRKKILLLLLLLLGLEKKKLAMPGYEEKREETLLFLSK
jgi:hypothetical protein